MPAAKRSTLRLQQLVEAVFGSADDPMSLLNERARRVLEPYPTMVWEADASTFVFRFVSRSAERLLGYPESRWTTEPTFWADVLVHPDDRDHALAYHALASGQGTDHDFIYRARRAGGSTAWLHAFVRVVPGHYGLPSTLRGVTIDVTDEQRETAHDAAFHAHPTFDMLRGETGLV